MLNKNMLSTIGLLIFSPWATLCAGVRIVESHGSSCPKTETETPKPLPEKSAKKNLVVSQERKVFLPHALSGSLVLRWLDVGDLTVKPFNGKNVKDINAKSNHDIVFDYSLMYHYRPAPSYSLGLSFDRLQVAKSPIDLRYVPSTTPAPPENTWDIIATDLNTGGTTTNLAVEPMAIGNFYDPESIGNRGYCYEFVARAYVYPALSFDPFFQVTVGWAHNRAAVHREDGSRSIASSDKFWTWSVGAGGSYALTQTLFLETSMQLRDQHRFQFEDTVRSYTTPAMSYVLSGSYDKYYSVDFKFTLRQTW